MKRRIGLAALAGVAIAAATSLGAAAEPSTVTTQSSGTSRVCAGAIAYLGCHLQVATGGGNAHAMLRGAQPMGWGATDIRRAYGLPAHSPHSGTIAVIDAGSYPTLSSDLAVYRKQYGLPACTTGSGCLRQLDFHGGPALPPPNSDFDKVIAETFSDETAVDTEMASAVCQDCSLLEMQIPTSELPTTTPPNYDRYADAIATATQSAIAAGADAVSISIAFPESAHMRSGPTADALKHKGIPITVASGDYGFQGDHALWPQSLPTVTSVGGTTLLKQGDRYLEGAWDMAGSGCVPATPPASGQPSAIAAHCKGNRAVSDVSAVAADIAYYRSYRPLTHNQVGWGVGSGTSASSPEIAAMYVAGGHLSGVLGPNTLYKKPRSAFTDITSGTNGTESGADGSCLNEDDVKAGTPVPFDNRLCQAQRGWDGPTGLGSPRGLAAF